MTYRVETRLRGTPQQYYILRIFDDKGEIRNVHTGKKYSYIENLIKTRYKHLNRAESTV